MKHLMKVFPLLTIIFSLTVAPHVRALEEEKQTYQTATLAKEITTTTVDERVYRLEQYLKSVNSPMVAVASRFIEEADKFGLDWKLVAAIAGNESYFGWYTPENSYNAWGWAVWTGMSYGAAFQNWEEGITTVSEGLKNNYVTQGLATVEQIGSKYAADPQWAWKVRHFMNKIEAFRPYEEEQHLLALSL